MPFTNPYSFLLGATALSVPWLNTMAPDRGRVWWQRILEEYAIAAPLVG